ncbi:hypothetical protein [Alkalicoccus luteus]|uniref:Uncharacterized protein n=1 Tax=Alkalicoccus luteus TaxID=1237094 RepID=A0A969TWK9_9BACI|nr:hypothetical protein [Alkalicoccus luteus]NJP39322.1 hypothetical protein [Alkalicoccus luteus]
MKHFLILASFLMLAACGPPTEFNAGTLLETRNTTPQTADPMEDVLNIADDEESLNEFWETYRFPGSPPDVDMTGNDVLFIKIGERL